MILFLVERRSGGLILDSFIVKLYVTKDFKVQFSKKVLKKRLLHLVSKGNGKKVIVFYIDVGQNVKRRVGECKI
jgi:hypothetical protein